MAIRCVVFDLDDTLYLERDYVRSGFAAVAAWARSELGVPGLLEAAWAAFERGTRHTVFNEVLLDAGVEPTKARIDALVAQYRRHVPSIDLLPDARACLETLSGRVTMAAISDGPIESQQAKVGALGLTRWLDPIVLTAELGPGIQKPHPRAYELVQARAGCLPQECAYVGDNPTKDFAAPASLGWRTVRVRRLMGLHTHLTSGREVEAEIPDLSTLPAVLRLNRPAVRGNSIP